MPRSVLVLVAAAALTAASPSVAAPAPTPSHVDYRAFRALTDELADFHATRLVSLTAFQKMAGEDGTLILDARSAGAFAAGHIAGAVNLPFTDFTAASLAQTIGDPNRRILIYCNNNFRNDAPPVMLKSVRLALNIQTFINLYGYGFRDVYELGETVDFNDPKVGWVTSGAQAAATVDAMKPPPSTRAPSAAS